MKIYVPFQKRRDDQHRDAIWGSWQVAGGFEPANFLSQSHDLIQVTMAGLPELDIHYWVINIGCKNLKK